MSLYSPHRSKTLFLQLFLVIRGSVRLSDTRGTKELREYSMGRFVPSFKLFLSVDGEVIEHIINAVKGETLSLKCHSLASSPANLLWRIDKRPVYTEASTSTRNEDGTFNSTSTLLFTPNEKEESIECVGTLDNSGEEKVVRGILTLEEQIDVQGVSHIIWVVLSCCVAGLIIFGNTVVCVKRKFRGLHIARLPRNANLSLAHQRQKEVEDTGPPKLALPEIPTALQQPEYAGYDTEIPQSRLPKIPAVQEHFEDREYATELPKQNDNPEYETEIPKFQLPKLTKLPAIPKSSEETEYSECEFKDAPSENYSTTLNDIIQARIFYAKEMHKTKRIKTGNLYIRWRGTINVSNDKSEHVIFTTLTDEVFRLNKVHWDKFVKRVVQLPESKHLCKIEGIGIDNAKQYLIHQKLTWRLNERIKATSKTDDGKTSRIPISPPEAIRLILGILEGMEVIHSSGFLHPRLSTKKILLTDKHHCQLYDFCLAEDAMEILTIRKPKMTYSLNELAPEGKEKSKYTSDSDVWSTAVVIWEIISGGLSPFNHDDAETTAFQTPPESWPKDYQQLSNNLVFECWDYNESLRPSIQELRISFQEIFKSVDTYNLPEVYGGSMAGWYVPMKEAAT